MAANTQMMNQQQDPENFEDANNMFDDDGKPKRTGTLSTGIAHIITAVIGSGVLSLAWATSQLGWIAGPLIIIIFSLITFKTSSFLADGYRGPLAGRRNYTYMNVVQSYLGGRKARLCGAAQYANLVGTSIGYTITASISMMTVKKSHCLNKHGHDEAICEQSTILPMVIFGFLQLFLCQMPNFNKLAWLSVIASIMSYTYSNIGIGLATKKVIVDGVGVTTLTGTVIGLDLSRVKKFWNIFQAIGNIAFAFTFSNILVEIQDTLKPNPPENKVMKMASLIGISITSVFYMLSGCIGYLAFGNNAPGNFLTGFSDPFWLVDIANISIVIHLIGAYQVFAQPLFEFVERKCSQQWPQSTLINKEYSVKIPGYGACSINLFRLMWRSAYVVVATVIAMIFPFFNAFIGLIGSLSYYPLTVYFPIEVRIAQAETPKYSRKWIILKGVSIFCFVICVVALLGSIQGLVENVNKFKPFQS